jgi:hypothetical protein
MIAANGQRADASHPRLYWAAARMALQATSAVDAHRYWMATRRLELPPNVVVAMEFVNHVRDGRGLAGIKEQCPASRHFGEAAGVCDGRGDPEAHRLERRQAKSFGTTREQEHARAAVHLPELGLRDVDEAVDPEPRR